ncbi:hypothetical protein BaRGS_00035491 [Batillaria attramentaria]|uniref:MAM domain-containing protein n=1 Tax=Batillaria attramentaria TaxID=370345 RepID=A0ABD0JE52_9CAEN
MRTLLCLSYLLACAVLIVSAENNDPDVTVIEEYTAANCDFARDWCGWTNKDDSNATVKWRLRDRIFGSDCLVADLSGKPKGNLALLASPWFKPNEHRQCSLRFRFFKGDTDACELAVTVATATSGRKIWSRTRGTFLAFFSTVNWIDIPFTDKIHRIVFEGRQLTGGSCGFHREIGVDDIRFRCFRAKIPTNQEQGLSDGGKAGIGIAALLLVVALVAVIVTILRKWSSVGEQCPLLRAHTTKRENTESPQIDGVVNSAYSVDTDDMKGSRIRRHDDDYEITDPPQRIPANGSTLQANDITSTGDQPTRDYNRLSFLPLRTALPTRTTAPYDTLTRQGRPDQGDHGGRETKGTTHDYENAWMGETTWM